MKKLLFIILALYSVLANSQKKFENNYLTMNIPNGWEVQNNVVEGANMEILSFNNSGNVMYNVGIVIGIEQEQDPSYILQNQMKLRSNIFFKDAEFGTIHTSVFMGKPACSVDFKTVLDGKNFKGAAYAFNEGGCSILALGCYKVGVKSNLPQIWRSIHWKEYQKVQRYSSLREEIKAYCESINKLWKANPISIDGEEVLSMSIEEGEDCLVYKRRLKDFSKDQIPAEKVNDVEKEIRGKMIIELKSEAQQTELLRRCMKEKYVFKYIYLDKNNDFFCSIKVTPDDYSE